MEKMQMFIQRRNNCSMMLHWRWELLNGFVMRDPKMLFSSAERFRTRHLGEKAQDLAHQRIPKCQRRGCSGMRSHPFSTDHEEIDLL
jgi:hypothetical protein